MSELGFIHPWMLAALPMVGLPVLIHFLTRARPTRVAFPPMKFLMEACAGQQAVHRLRAMLLLLLRCLAVLGLVLLFARPFLRSPGATADPQAARRVVIIVDASFSMRAVDQGVTLFARAQAEAAEVLRGLGTDGAGAVILAGASARPLLPALSRNIPALHEMLGKAEPTFERGDPGAALAAAKRLLGDQSGTVYLFSDFQQSEWADLAEVPSGLICKFRAVTEQPIENVAVTRVQLAPAMPVIGEPTEVVCTVFNSSARPRQETVRLELGDMAYESAVTLPPYGRADAVFQVTFPVAAVLSGGASVQPDNLAEDNKRHVVVRIQEALEILLVSDSEPADARSAAFFVSRALAPSAEAAPGFKVVRRHSQETDRGMLETADLFIVVAPAQLSGEAQEIMSRRVNEGAWLMSFLDEPGGAVLAPAALNPPFQLQRSMVAPAGEPLIAGLRPVFSEGGAGDWSGVRVRRYYQNRVLDGRAQEVLLSYPDGSAALTLGPAGQGGVVFVNMALTPDAGGDVVGSPLFPSLLHELVRALRAGGQPRETTPGVPWTLDSPAQDSTALVLDPEGEPVEAKVLASGRETRLALPEARMPGVYQVRHGDQVTGAGAVNIDARESDTRPMALESVKAGEGTEVALVREETHWRAAGEQRELWPHLAAAAALFLALEMLLLALWRPNRLRPAVAAPARGAAPVAEMESVR